MTERSKATIQIVLVVLAVSAVIGWWAIYRWQQLLQPTTYKPQPEVIKNIEESNKKFLQQLESLQNQLIPSSTPSILPAPATTTASSTNNQK